MLADGALLIIAYFLAFQLRFLDEPGGMPDRYNTLFMQSAGIVLAGKLVIFRLFGLYQKWWRFISSRDMLRIIQ